MQWIVDNLFVGNKLATAEIVTGDGVRIDLRNITLADHLLLLQGRQHHPAAAGAGLDPRPLRQRRRHPRQRPDHRLLRARQRSAISASSSPAAWRRRSTQEFATNIDFIDCLPPGLYEAVLTPRARPAMRRRGLVVGDYLVRFEQRTLDDIRALGGNDLEDERKFAAVARLSEINLGLYRTFLQPWRAGRRPPSRRRELLRQLSPSRLQFELFSDQNPLMAPVAAAAELVRADRRPVAADNPFLAAQEAAVRADRGGARRLARLARRRGRGDLPRRLRLAGGPGAAGPARQRRAAARRGPAASRRRSRFVQQRIAELKARIGSGRPARGVRPRDHLRPAARARRRRAGLRRAAARCARSTRATCASPTSRRWCATSS